MKPKAIASPRGGVGSSRGRTSSLQDDEPVSAGRVGEPAAHGDCVHIARARIGLVTSGTKSPVLKKKIARARLDVAHAEPVTEVEVGKLDGHQKRFPATVVGFPFYDPKKERPRS